MAPAPRDAMASTDAAVSARRMLIGVVALLLMSAPLALFMRAEHWDPDGTFSAQLYQGAWRLHAAFSAAVMMGTLVLLARAPSLRGTNARSRGVHADGGALALWGGGSALLALVAIAGWSPAWRVAAYIGACAAFTGVAGINLAQLVLSLRRGGRSTCPGAGFAEVSIVGALLVAMLGVALGLVTLFAAMGRTPAPWSVTMSAPLVVAALGTLPFVMAGRLGRRVGSGWMFGVAIATLVTPMISDARELCWTPIIGAPVYAWMVCRGSWRRAGRDAWALAALMLVVPSVLVMASATAVVSFVGGTESGFLTDTYWGVIAEAMPPVLGLFVLLMTVLAEPSAFRVRYSPRWAKLGIALLAPGFVASAVAMIVTGAGGMPRRYWAYLPEFEESQRVASVGALIATIGALILITSFVDGSRATTVADREHDGLV